MAKHSDFCIKTVLHNPLSQIVIKEDFNFGEALESVYPLLDIIFSYLNDKDLVNVGQVKNLWKDISEKIFKKRPPNLCWVTCFKKYKSNIIEHSQNLHYNDAKIGIFFIDDRMKQTKNVCLHTDTVNLPGMTFAEYLSKEIVNTRMTYCLLHCHKVVSLLTNDISYSKGSTFDGILLPEISGIRTTMFYCNSNELKKSSEYIDNFIQENEEVKCLLLFRSTYQHKSIYSNLFKVLMKDIRPEDVAVGGGIIRGMETFQGVQNVSKETSNRYETFCIAFLKKKDTNPLFNAASFVIQGNNFSHQEFNEEVSKFRERVIIRRASIAFRICCRLKSDTFELKIFKEYFPNTPLLGLKADGEIGWNSFNLPDDEGSKPKISKTSYPKIQHQMSTVFVLITWGEIINE